MKRDHVLLSEGAAGELPARGRVLGNSVLAMLFLSGVTFTCVPTAFGDTYLPGPPPTFELKHEAEVDLPAPKTRTEVGICERVKCEIINFLDIDYQVDPETGSQRPVQDEMDTVTWSAYYGGTVVPLRGTSTTLTVRNCDIDYFVTVQAYVNDKAIYADDPPAAPSICFQIYTPKTSRAYFWSASDLSQPGNEGIGCRGQFEVQSLPDNVNFGYASWRECISRDFTQKWPDQSIHYFPHEGADEYTYNPWSVGTHPVEHGGPNVPNAQRDESGFIDMEPISRLGGPPGAPVAFVFTVILQFKGQPPLGGTEHWVDGPVNTHRWEFAGDGKATARMLPAAGPAQPPAKGPWKWKDPQ